MIANRRLEERATALAAADGTCTIVVGPPPPFRYWQIGRWTLTADGSPGASAVIYRGADRIDSTSQAQSNTSTVGATLMAGEQASIVFASVTPGARCSVWIEGDDRATT